MSVSKSHGFCVNQRFTKHRTYKTQCFDEKVYPTPTTTTYEPTVACKQLFGLVNWTFWRSITHDSLVVILLEHLFNLLFGLFTGAGILV